MANNVQTLLGGTESTSPLSPSDAESVAADLGQMTGLAVYAGSIAALQRGVLFLARSGDSKVLGCVARDETMAARFHGESRSSAVADLDVTITVGPANAANAASLRELLPFLVATPLGLQKSAGCGDRLGLATPGHIRAFRSTFGTPDGTGMAPIFAQQSIRENARTGRTPQEVMDDAMWGVFQEGWRGGYGADADHLMTTAHVDSCAAAGYTFFTVDPGAHVDDRANVASISQLGEMAGSLPWAVLEDNVNDLTARLCNRAVDLGDFEVVLSDEDVLRAAAKYGHAIAHTVRMYQHLASVMGERPYEFEMSVDETETVTTLAEHVYIASELQRLGVRCVSLAPRYVGAFEKGVDYIGDLDAFEQSITQHMAVSRTFGPYKLSLHSGSDKFSIYPIAARVAGELVHLKTAGTSYLEAVRAIAAMEPALFREIVAFARQRYPDDRASYHVSADLAKMPDILEWNDEQLPRLLDNFDAREVLHVTFGSVLNHQPFRAPFYDALRTHEETYSEMLEAHFIKHLAPFAS